MDILDISIIAGYFVFIIVAAFIFKRFAKTSSGFIRGGGAMMWWMAGATAFMTQFSAWTFTGAAAKAYEDGLAVLFLFWGNALGFFVAAMYFASRYRKLRVDTAMEVIRMRFGRLSEQVFTWLQFPLTTISAAIWLNGLAIFVAAVFHIDLYITIIGVGILVTFIAVSGGSWTVSATNVIQLVLLMAITLTVGAYALIYIGGPVELIEKSEIPSFMGTDINYWQIFVVWIVFIMMKQTIGTNNAMSCYRFLVTVNEKEAQKAAWVAGIMFIIGPIMWFIPPWVTATMHVDLQTFYPNLGTSANNAAYLFFIQNYMPQGVLGLVLAAMIAATIAPMTTALNRNAGIFVRNVYQSVINPKATEAQQMRLSKLSTIFNGVISIGAALLFASIQEYSFFDLMMLFGALLQIPLAIPSLMGMVIVKTPDWSAWATLVVGLLVSCFMQFVFHVDWLLPLFNAESFTHRESVDLTVVAMLMAQIVITGGFFALTSIWYKAPKEARKQELERFYHNVNTPISAEEEALVDGKQGAYLGRLSQVLGILIILVGVIFETGYDMLTFIVIGGLILWAGSHLYKSRLAIKQVTEEAIISNGQ